MKTLLATDGSVFSRLTEELAVRIPTMRSGDFIVASVANPPTPMMTPMMPISDAVLAQNLSDIWQRVQADCEAHSQGAVDRLAAKGIKAESRLLEGSTSPALMECAATEACDVIAVGSRGEGAFKSFFLGSVARNLANHAKQSVLIGRHDEDHDADATMARVSMLKKLRIVAACDGSDGANVALQALADCGEDTFEEIFVICAEPLLGLPLGIPASVYESSLRYEEEQAKEVVSKAAHLLQECAVRTVAEIKVGRPADVICDAARRHKADLVVIGASRHGTLERALLGSVAFEVATHAPCSVWIVRPK